MHNSKSPETSRCMFLEYIKNIGRRKYQRGATSQPQEWRVRPLTLWTPWKAFGAHLWLYEVFRPGKNHKEAIRMKRRRLEAEPGQNQSRAPAELFCRGNFPPGGGNRSHHHYQRFSHRGRTNLHQHLHQHHLLLNPSSSLVSNLCLIAWDWYLWVASSVDYSL